MFLALLLVASVLPSWFGVETVQYAYLQKSASPSFIVVDPTGAPIPDTIVEKCLPKWRSCSEAGRTDPEGRFRFDSDGKQHYFRLRHDLFNPVEFRMKVDRKLSKELSVKLPIAT